MSSMLEPSATYRTPFSFANAMIFRTIHACTGSSGSWDCGETLDLQFLRLHNKVTVPSLFAERRCLVQLPLGERTAPRGHGNMSPSVSCATFNKECGIHPAGKATATLPSSADTAAMLQFVHLCSASLFDDFLYTKHTIEVGFNVKRNRNFVWIFARLWYNFGKGRRKCTCLRHQRDGLFKPQGQAASGIAQIGPIEREVDTDLFAAVVHHIIGQQISMKAQGHHLATDAGRPGHRGRRAPSGGGGAAAATTGRDLPQGGIHHGFFTKIPTAR